MKENTPDITEDQLKKIGNRLRQLRKEKGYNNYEHFAFQHELNRAQYGRYENGANMSIKTLLKILTAFDMTLPEFFAEGFEDEKSDS
jgi:transcriptional regulator with XRE-family HTH domain